MKVKSNKVGVCPFCNHEGELEYGCVSNEDDNMCYYKWRCLNCNHEGEEWYYLEFVGHNVFDENGNCIEIEDKMIEKGE